MNALGKVEINLMQKGKKGFALQNLRWYHRSCLVSRAGAPYYDLAKEREGAPLSFPRRSCPNPVKLPSFSVATLTASKFAGGGW